MFRKNKVPKQGAKGFLLTVLPSRKHLDKAIELDGFCKPDKCWHKVAIAAVLQQIDPNGNHHVRIDGGHVKFNLLNWRYVADTPRHVKRSLMLFDKRLYDQVYIRPYNLRCRRTTKVVKVARERQDQINQARMK